MNKFVLLACVMLSSRCNSIPVEDSVVSVYTTQSTTAGTHPPLDVYHQIANNIAERITSPIYRFFGYNRTSTVPPETTKPTTVSTRTTKPTTHRTELLEDQDLTTNKDVKPIDNDIEKARDVEELSPDQTTPQKRPEKITLYSSLMSAYLPARLEENKTSHNEVDSNDDSLELDDVDLDDPTSTPREGPFIYIMEWIGSMIQLIWGGLQSLFKPSSS